MHPDALSFSGAAAIGFKKYESVILNTFQSQPRTKRIGKPTNHISTKFTYTGKTYNEDDEQRGRKRKP